VDEWQVNNVQEQR